MTENKYTTPHFAKNLTDDHHFKTLRELVTMAIKELPVSRLQVARMKAFILPLLFMAIYLIALMQTAYILFATAYIFLGFLLVILFLNLIHEACHNSLFKRKQSNQLYMLLFDLIGANSYMWKKRHVKLHHNFTNVYGWDSDIERSQFLKVHPQDNQKPTNQYQHFMILVYPAFITNWFLIRDFKDFFFPGMLIQKLGPIPLLEYMKLLFFKLFLIGYMVVIPVLVTPFLWWQVVLTFFGMTLTAGFFALTVLLPPHVNTSNQFPLADDANQLQQSWLKHHLNTTNDVDSSNWFTKHIMANSNFHIAHHLFPNISYVYAKEVTDVIKEFCRENGLPYRSYPLFTTFKNHYRLIKTNGQFLLNMQEADM